MKTIILVLVAAFGLSACALEYRDGYGYGGQRHYDNDSYNYYGNRDRDRDGVPNRQDRRPDDPRRY